MSELELLRTMLKQAEANLDYFVSIPDSAYDDIAACIERVAYYSSKLNSMTFRQIAGAAR